jgi:uncharacterized glyoxalase superfamily protein PhnB
MSVDAGAGAVTASVVVDVEPGVAFAVFTGEIGAWYRIDRFTVSDHRRAVGIRFEPGVGGRLMEVHHAATGDGTQLGRVTAWEPGVRLGWVDGRGVEVEVTFVAAGSGATRVTLEQRGLDRLPPPEAQHVRRFGWHVVLDWFGVHVSGAHVFGVHVSGARRAEPPSREERPMPDDTTTATAADPGSDSVSNSVGSPGPGPAVGANARFLGVSPYLYYADAGAALEWLARTFGFEERARYVDDGDVVHEAEMAVGTATLMLCGRAPDPGQGEGVLLVVHVDDVEAQHARVTAAGGEAAPPEDQPYGPRTFTVTDPWGYRWTFWQQLRDFEDGTGGLREIRP